MLINIANQQKLDELTNILAALPLDVTRTFEGDTFPMVGEIRMNTDGVDTHKIRIDCVVNGIEMWMTVERFEEMLEEELNERFRES